METVEHVHQRRCLGGKYRRVVKKMIDDYFADIRYILLFLKSIRQISSPQRRHTTSPQNPPCPIMTPSHPRQPKYPTASQSGNNLRRRDGHIMQTHDSARLDFILRLRYHIRYVESVYSILPRFSQCEFVPDDGEGGPECEGP